MMSNIGLVHARFVLMRPEIYGPTKYEDYSESNFQ
jgi:hypothetical protein